ncbi:hypothetical protein Ddye_001697 [Dipteronia dyeriana]|uniref:RNase H type-1 domain-containing protein n=1 Tax=Dipteronia dyeriana TaxID=168575 RepID=A0AAD9XPN9_9ROSI|nr:hypothetical protein Ddye_001697 [Dipteronia dyeriana]
MEGIYDIPLPNVNWSPLDKGKFKLNCAFAIDKCGNKIGSGAIIIDSKGEVLTCCSQSIEANYTVKAAILVAIQKGLQFDIDVVKWINNGLHRDSEFRDILLDIRKLSNCLENMMFCQIPTSPNKATIGLAKHLLSTVEEVFWMEDFPVCISNVIEAEKPR